MAPVSVRYEMDDNWNAEKPLIVELDKKGLFGIPKLIDPIRNRILRFQDLDHTSKDGEGREVHDGQQG